MREMILAETEQREKALEQAAAVPARRLRLGIFTAMKGLPVTIRLLDPPLHEFLPHDEKAHRRSWPIDLDVSPAKAEGSASAAARANPMLGHRGCRLAVTYPEILQDAGAAIVEARSSATAERVDGAPRS